MARFRMVVAYDGSPFAGWQSQPGGNTIQDHIEAAIRIITGTDVRIHGSGRTDAGVHALGQVAHFDAPEHARLSADAWQRAINNRLPPAIRIMDCRPARDGFHARFDATGKRYDYRIWNDPVLPPLEVARVWHVPKRLDLPLLQEACSRITGTHDFAGFAANRGDGKPAGDTVRTLHEVRLSRSGPDVRLSYHGSGFLYRMVRLLTGSLVRVASGRAPLAWLTGILDREGDARSPFAAPADGLYLMGVDYPDPTGSAPPDSQPDVPS